MVRHQGYSSPPEAYQERRALYKLYREARHEATLDFGNHDRRVEVKLCNIRKLLYDYKRNNWKDLMSSVSRTTDQGNRKLWKLRKSQLMRHKRTTASTPSTSATLEFLTAISRRTRRQEEVADRARLSIEEWVRGEGTQRRSALDDEFTIQKVQAATGQLGREKAPGPDGIPHDTYRPLRISLTSSPTSPQRLTGIWKHLICFSVTRGPVTSY